MTKSDKGKPSQQESIYPQESLMKVPDGNSALSIGIPKEVSVQENRVSLNPEAVGLLVANGHHVSVESTAGVKAKFTDREYSEAGGKISYDTGEVFKCDIVLKIEPPTQEEIGNLVPGKTLISALQMGSRTIEYLQALNEKRITAVAIEQIEDKVGGLPVVRAMSEVAGSSVMPIATEYLNSVNNGKGILLGGVTGVPPTKVVILGAGTVAEYAARAALGLGAQIQVFDNHIYKLRRIKHALGHQIYTSTIDAAILIESLKSADVVIGAVRAEKGRNRCIVTEEMVASMKPGSIIIDVSIDQGGCFETSEVTTHSNPIFKKFDVIHYCVPNIASRVARTATDVFSHIFTPVLLQITEVGSVEDMIFANRWFMKGVYTFKGNITNADIGRKFKLKCKDLSLFIGTRF
jgi:alanine dehydrogenase